MIKNNTIRRYKNKYLNKVFGIYKVLDICFDGNTYEDVKFIVQCTKCKWIGKVSKKCLKKALKRKYVRCIHPGGNINPGDKFGKYEIIKKMPAKLSNKGILYPRWKCLCHKCNMICIVPTATLYSAAARNTSKFIACKHNTEDKL